MTPVEVYVICVHLLLFVYIVRKTENNPNLICNPAFTVGRNLKSTTKCKVKERKKDGSSYKVEPEENTS